MISCPVCSMGFNCDGITKGSGIRNLIRDVLDKTPNHPSIQITSLSIRDRKYRIDLFDGQQVYVSGEQAFEEKRGFHEIIKDCPGLCEFDDYASICSNAEWILEYFQNVLHLANLPARHFEAK